MTIIDCDCPPLIWSFDSNTVSALELEWLYKNCHQRSRIKTLPFIRLDPSNPSTIYTALCFSQAQSEKHNLSRPICPVTFDQPLYQKATEIVAASRDLDKVVVRLGGFHMLMSYLGSIGHTMHVSGLADLWERVYAIGSVVHMLTGHAFLEQCVPIFWPCPPFYM